MANAIPDGFTAITPHLIVKGCGEAIDFYKKAFGATEVCRMNGPDGTTVMHVELDIGNARIMLADEFPDMGSVGPQTIGGTPVTIHFYVEDCDAVMQSAVEAGATMTMPAMDMFWGDRYGKVTDPYGHSWAIATHKEDLSPEQIEKAGQEFMAKMGGECGG